MGFEGGRRLHGDERRICGLENAKLGFHNFSMTSGSKPDLELRKSRRRSIIRRPERIWEGNRYDYVGA